MKTAFVKLLGKLIVEYGPSIVEAILEHRANKKAAAEKQ